MGRTQPPSIDELVNELRRTLGPFRGKPVTVRLLDVGSDKPLQFTAFLSESNPSLGRRGVRLMREYPDLLYTQIKAIVQLLEEFELQILVPMVTLPDDMEFVRDILIEQCSQHNLASPKLGAMIETPAAALSAKQIGKFVDFMSFGTNDLTQYAFAADRENASVEPYFKDSSDVIFRLISIVHEDVPTMPLSVCGELAGRQKHTEKLLLSGISSLSVAAPLVSIIKQQVRSIRLDRNDTI